MRFFNNKPPKRRRAAGAALLAALALAAGPAPSAAIGGEGAAEPKAVTTAVPFDDSEDGGGFRKVAETTALKLFYNEEEDVLRVDDKAAGVSWSSRTDWTGYGLEEPNPMQNSFTGSMLSLTFTDVVANEGKLTKVYSALEDNTRTVEAMDNGIAVNYDFSLLHIQLTLEITLDDEGLCLRLPQDKITEGERNLLMAVELLPGFASSNNQDTGYILYPDGCGALLKYENAAYRPNGASSVSLGVYGAYGADIEDYFQSTGLLGNLEPPQPYTAALPLFGVRKNGNGFLAYVSEGAAQSKINLSPQGNSTPFNTAAFELQYRDTFEMILSSISAGSSADVQKGTKVDKVRMAQDYEVHYTFLAGQDSTYSGMARHYRQYLLDNGLLCQTASAEAPLALDLFCGITEDRMLMDHFVKATTFRQSEEILQSLLDKGVTSQQVTLKGWAKGGYTRFTSQWPAEGSLGGSSGLKSLHAFAGENGLSLFVQNTPLLANSADGGFSVRREAVYTANTLPFTDEENELYLLHPAAVSERLSTLANKLPEGIGISSEGIGRTVYANYREASFSMREGTARQWADALSALKQGGRSVASEYGNQYTLAYSDRLYNVPIETSQTSLSDETVPFYQMVVHGSIPYTANAGNLFYDEDLQKLQWIEFGCLPYYELTYERASVLKYTAYNQLYTSYYGDWVGKAAAVWQEFNTRLAGTWDSAMTEHERLSADVVKVSYESGKTVYINYGSSPAAADGQSIPAMDYVVV